MKIEIDFNAQDVIDKYIKENIEWHKSLSWYLRYCLEDDINTIKKQKIEDEINKELQKMWEEVMFNQSKNFTSSRMNEFNSNVSKHLSQKIDEYIEKKVSDYELERKIDWFINWYIKNKIEPYLTKQIQKMICISTDEIDDIHSCIDHALQTWYEAWREQCPF